MSSVLSLLAQGTLTSLPGVNSADMDGNTVRLSVSGIAGAGTVNLKCNGTTFVSYSVTNGDTFCISVEFAWDSTNQVLTHNSGASGGITDTSVGNPSTFTFSTDSSHTVHRFALSLV